MKLLRWIILLWVIGNLPRMNMWRRLLRLEEPRIAAGPFCSALQEVKDGKRAAGFAGQRVFYSTVDQAVVATPAEQAQFTNLVSAIQGGTVTIERLRTQLELATWPRWNWYTDEAQFLSDLGL